MARTIVIDIPDETHERLAKLSRFFGRDVDKTVLDLLESLSESDNWLETLGEKYKPAPVALSNFLTNLTTSAVAHLHSMDNIPEIFKVKGVFWITSLKADIDNDHFEFSYNTLPGCKLAVHRFVLNMDHGKPNLYTLTVLDLEKISVESLDKLKEALQKLQPSEFSLLERFTIEIKVHEGLFFIDINCFAGSVKDFPSVRRVSALLKRVFKKCGIMEDAWRD